MKERPIIFRGSTVRAILEGRKTTTRRTTGFPQEADSIEIDDTLPSSHEWQVWKDGERRPNILCPYGIPGDELWVRETWRYDDWTEDGDPYVRYAADDAVRLCEIPWDWDEKLADIWADLSVPSNLKRFGRARDPKWRPSIFMPRWSSGIMLEITDVRIERLQEITEEGAQAEGASDVREFISLWKSINGYKAGCSWQGNPWVWCVDFRVCDADPGYLSRA